MSNEIRYSIALCLEDVEKWLVSHGWVEDRFNGYNGRYWKKPGDDVIGFCTLAEAFDEERENRLIQDDLVGPYYRRLYPESNFQERNSRTLEW